MSTGATFKTAGLNHIVVGRTTMDQASDYLGARPVDVWQQGDSTLARWAYSATAATDAVYFRQEAWLRFGPDGTFQRMENGVNIPPTQHPRTAEEADRAAPAQSVPAAPQPASAPPVAPEAEATPVVVAPGDTGGLKPVTVPASDAIQPASMAIPASAAPAAARKPSSTPKTKTKSAKPSQPAHSPVAQPLLPAGTQVVPGVTYPVGKTSR
jgi:hypothetical protein